MIDFKLNQEFIAKVLCIEKDEPITTCYGKCQLTTQLNKVNEEEKGQVPSSKKERLEVLHYLEKQTNYALSLSNCDLTAMKAFQKGNAYHYAFVYDVFHPPKPFIPTISA